MKPYDELAIVPYQIAQTVCGEPYTGQDLSPARRDARQVAKVEAARQQMTAEQVATFASFADERCRVAYERGADWMLKCARSRSNRGRDQLYVYIRHWLAGYLIEDGRDFVDELLAIGFKPSKFTHGQFHEGYQLAKGGKVFTFTKPAEVHYIRQICEAAAC